MRPVEQWIWLPEADYPQNQITRYSERVHKRTEKNYTVAAFSKAYCFLKPSSRYSCASAATRHLLCFAMSGISPMDRCCPAVTSWISKPTIRCLSITLRK